MEAMINQRALMVRELNQILTSASGRWLYLCANRYFFGASVVYDCTKSQHFRITRPTSRRSAVRSSTSRL